MSRIGNLPITVPKGITVHIDKNVVTVKNAKNELIQVLDPIISASIENDVVKLTRSAETKDAKAKHGLYRSLIHNMIIGLDKGYKKVMELIGVGFRATIQGQTLDLSLGYSHGIVFVLPKEVSCEVVSQRGKAPVVTFQSFDKQLIGAISAKLRSFRKPEPYKGKGIRFQGEQIRRKAGKTAAK